MSEMPYALEKRLLKKLDLMIDRVTRDKPAKDALLQNHGGEGEGKSNASIAEAGYIKWKTKRDIHLFFRLEELINFAKNNTEKIIIWDEPSLDSLSSEQLKEINKDQLRLFMTIRKNRHFFIINYTKFWKFPEYMTVDRSLGMVHLYSRKEIEPGRFRYIKKKNLEMLYNNYVKRKQRTFKKLSSFGGKFPEVMVKHYNNMDITINNQQHSTLEDYERQKTFAIQSIGGKGMSRDKRELLLLRKRIATLELPIKSLTDFSKKLKIHRRILYAWKVYDVSSIENRTKMPVFLVNRNWDSDIGTNSTTTGVQWDGIDSTIKEEDTFDEENDPEPVQDDPLDAETDEDSSDDS